MKMKKLDLSGIKEFLFAKGERVALGLCGVIAVLLIAMALLRGSGKPKEYSSWNDALKKETDRLQVKLNDIVREENIGDDDKVAINKQADAMLPPTDKMGWLEILRINQFFVAGDYFALGEKFDLKRRNPRIFAVRENVVERDPTTGEIKRVVEKNLQADVVRGGRLALNVHRQRKEVDYIAGPEKGGQPAIGVGVPAGAGGNQRLVEALRPMRMVVVSGVFPWKDQLHEYTKALRFQFLNELQAKPDLMPKPLGLNVYRFEVLGDGKLSKPDELFVAKDGKIKVKDAIDYVLRDSLVDQNNLVQYDGYLRVGLATPLPKLAHGRYPKLELEGIAAGEIAGETIDDPKVAVGKGDPKVGMPPVGSGGKLPGVKKDNKEDAEVLGEGETIKGLAWSKLSKDLQERFAGKYDPFNPYGSGAVGGEKKEGIGMPGDIKDKGPVGKTPAGKPLVGMPPVGKQSEVNETAADAGYDLVARFIDPTAEPGRTYIYAVQVRMENPNFSADAKELAYKSLGEIKELLSDFAYTNPVTIPTDYFFYAADQAPKMPIPGGADPANKSASENQAAFQIHRWVGEFKDNQNTDHAIGSWAILERMLVRRGEAIGKMAMVEVPKWIPEKGRFEIGHISQAAKGKADPKKKAFTGLPIDFDLYPSPVLVDFDGGKRNSKVGAASITEETATNVLVLMPDDRLVVRNSRVDTDPEFQAGKERQERVDAWWNQLQRLRGGAMTGPNPGGPGLPGVGPRQ